jgi:hypothetical protein
VLAEQRSQTHCRFGELEPVGSVRLAHYLQSVQPRVRATDFQVLFVSSLESSDEFDAIFGHYYRMEFERRAIRLVNRLADGGADVAYYPRHEGELHQLEAHGLLCPRISYLPRSVGGVYHAIDRSAVVVSTVSTATLEALAMERPAGYINLSGNQSIHAPFRDAGLMFEDASPHADIAEFVSTLPSRTQRANGFIVQRDDLADAIVRAVAASAAPGLLSPV